MSNNTFLITILSALAAVIVSIFVFFPDRAADVVGSIRRTVNPKHIDLVRMEYITADPEQSRGWRTLRVFDKPEDCLPLLQLDHSRTPGLPGPLGAVRCTAYRKTGEMMEVLGSRTSAPALRPTAPSTSP